MIRLGQYPDEMNVLERELVLASFAARLSCFPRFDRNEGADVRHCVPPPRLPRYPRANPIGLS